MKYLTIMAALFCATCGATAKDTEKYPSDIIETRNGKELKITFFGHGSIAFGYDGHWYYVDPVSDFADYSTLPKADVIVVTHEHGDHLDAKAIATLWTPGTVVIGNATAIEAFGLGIVLAHGEVVESLGEGTEAVRVEAVPAYNTSPEKLGFHPQARLHNGYVFTFGGTWVYVAGDTEPIPEMTELHGMDIVFLPVNLPYTMTEEQAAQAVKTIRPKIFYPYHYGRTDHKTDLEKLQKLLEGTGIEVRIRPLE